MSIEVTITPFYFAKEKNFPVLKAGRVAIVDPETIMIKGTKKVESKTLKKEEINTNISDVIGAATNPLRTILGQTIIFHYKKDQK